MLALLDAGLPGPARGVFTTRRGGASTGPWVGLDLALHVGDDPAHVEANRALLRDELGVDRLVLGEQVHGTRVAVVTAGAPDVAPGTDGLVTAERGTALVMMAADCLPVLLADPVAGVVGAAHAGRQGLVDGVLQEVLAAMASLGARDVTARIGPAVCGACYELPEALADAVGAAVPGSRSTTSRGTPGADLPAGAEALLRAAGVRDVQRVGGCTVEQPDLLYSHRRDGVTGRHAGVAWLP